MGVWKESDGGITQQRKNGNKMISSKFEFELDYDKSGRYILNKMRTVAVTNTKSITETRICVTIFVLSFCEETNM